jgi:predicted ATP-binding protein involved in virulence
MRIRKITVKDLFGIFNHEIPLNTQDHITIVHGPNGYGKTKILSMVNDLFNANYIMLTTVPFRELLVDFDDGSTLSVQSAARELDQEIEEFEIGLSNDVLNDISFRYKHKNKRSWTKPYTPPLSIRERFPMRYFDREIEKIGPSLWLHLPTGERLTREELYRFSDRHRYLEFVTKKEPEWLSEINNSINVYFIETQRLFNIPSERKSRESKESKEKSSIQTVMNYSKELADRIKTKLADYGTISQSKDRTFPFRLVGESKLTELKVEEIETKIRELEEKRSRIESTGLLDEEERIDFSSLRNTIDENKKVLSIYIRDVEEKLRVFDDLTSKIDLLRKIIKKKFLYKELKISKQEGFVFETSNHKKISPTSLSSGEQHELVLFYQLLFDVKPNSLILIDEPEISLHVKWQTEFIDDLQEIIKIAGFDTLIATHSPQIINRRWRLTVALKGPEE